MVTDVKVMYSTSYDVWCAMVNKVLFCYQNKCIDHIYIIKVIDHRLGNKQGPGANLPPLRSKMTLVLKQNYAQKYRPGVKNFEKLQKLPLVVICLFPSLIDHKIWDWMEKMSMKWIDPNFMKTTHWLVKMYILLNQWKTVLLKIVSCAC